MLLKNAEIYGADFHPVRADLSVQGGKIAAIGQNLGREDEEFDLSGCTVIPGFVDMHIHGCRGFDTCDGTREAVSGMAEYLVTKGVTSFCPTTMTVSHEEIERAVYCVRECMDHPPEGAAVQGVNMEGPYISLKRKGSQKGDFVRNPNWNEFSDLCKRTGDAVRIVDIAPECRGATEFITKASQICRVSMAHTEADYDQATESFRTGITHVTHLFNAMPGLAHREPGAVGAVFDNNSVKAELICDGFHIHPAVLRIAFRLLGEDRAVVVSDSMRAAGQPDGLYDLGGQTVCVKHGQARIADGTIAGSTTNLYEEFKNLVGYGIPFREALKAATINPAIEIGREDAIGSIREGKSADLVVLDGELNLKLVVARGKIYVNNL